MLLKLLKYDIKSTAVKMLTTFAVFAIVCIIIPPIIKLFQKDAALVYMVFTVPVGVIAMCIVVFIFIFQRYNSGLYGNEGSLMFTLPVKGRYLLLSKIITAFLWAIAGTILSVAAIFTIVYVNMSFDKFIAGATKLTEMRVLNSSLILLAIVSLLIALIEFIIQVYFSITVSKLPIWRKFGVAVGILTYLAMDYIDSLPMIWFSPSNDIKYKGVNLLLIQAITEEYIWYVLIHCLFSVVLTIAMFIATAVLMEKKTSLR